MRRKRITGRFYVFLVLLLVGGYFVLRELLPSTTGEAIVKPGNTTFARTVDAVIVRDEDVDSYEGNGRIVYVASEGATVNAGDEICKIYSAGYSEKEMLKLETVRQSIRDNHQITLDNIVDPELDRLEQRVEESALQLKTLIAKKSGGSLTNLEKQLESVMAERQVYLSNHRRENLKLNQLYEEEKKRVGAISAWETIKTAQRQGVISFYLDGFERLLTEENLPSLTAEDVRAVLAGKRPTASAAERILTSVFRVVSPSKWYVILLSSETDWNLDTGRAITFQVEGFDDVAFTGTVITMKKTANELMAQVEVAGGLGPLINLRTGKVDIGVYMTGLSVPRGAILTQGGQTGVIPTDMPGETFIPVKVLSTDSQNALIQPLAEGTLIVGQRVRVK